VCNLYAIMRARAEAARLASVWRDRNGNAPPMPGVFPDYAAPVVLRGEDGQREMRDLRWGLPSSQKALLDAATRRADRQRAQGKAVDFPELLKMEPDKGTTNVRNTSSRHWQRWLGPAHRCLVPFTSFSEPDQVGGSLETIWFALDDTRPLAFFAGIWTPWACVRKVKTGWEECELYGFLTTDANADVGAYHSKAMPVILTEPAEWDRWLSDAPWDAVQDLQRPLPDGVLKVVGRGGKKDEVAPA
jgi:putative SOS response-associated peptidase YedK